MCLLFGLAASYGFTLLLRAQYTLNQRAELYAVHNVAPSTRISSTPSQPDREPLTAPVSMDGPAADVRPNHKIEPVTGTPTQPTLASVTIGTSTCVNGPAEPNPLTPRNVTSPECGRTTAIRVRNAESIADAAAGDRRVDVILTYQIKGSAPHSDVVLENVGVITIEPVADENNNARTAAHTVTLDVDDATAQNLLLASQTGSLSLVLRKPDNQPRHANIPELARDETEPDDPNFTHVRVNRIGGESSTHKVPRER